MAEVGGMLRDLRRKAGLTQESLGEAVGVTHEYISRVERGKISPSWRFLTNLANVLHVPVADLLAAAGLVDQPALPREEVAAMIAAYPRLAAAFEYARRTGDRSLLADLERQAQLLLLEKERDDHGGTEPGGGTDRENPPAGN